MNYQELKKMLRMEFRVKTGEYLSFGLGDESNAGEPFKFVNIDFPINFKTYFFCKMSVKEHRPDYEIVKIVTINYKGETFTFKTFDEFVAYVKALEIVEYIAPY